MNDAQNADYVPYTGCPQHDPHPAHWAHGAERWCDGFGIEPVDWDTDEAAHIDGSGAG